jgi:hypothetical protein
LRDGHSTYLQPSGSLLFVDQGSLPLWLSRLLRHQSPEATSTKTILQLCWKRTSCPVEKRGSQLTCKEKLHILTYERIVRINSSIGSSSFSDEFSKTLQSRQRQYRPYSPSSRFKVMMTGLFCPLRRVAIEHKSKCSPRDFGKRGVHTEAYALLLNMMGQPLHIPPALTRSITRILNIKI